MLKHDLSMCPSIMLKHMRPSNARTDVRTNEELLTLGLSSHLASRAQGGRTK
jgi:hypothetical protein